MGRPVRRHASASVQGGARVPLLAGVCASHRNPRSARLAGPVNRSHIAIPCTAHPNDCENRTVQQRLCAPCYVGANITRAAPHIRSRQDRAPCSQARARSVRANLSAVACSHESAPLPARNRTFSDGSLPVGSACVPHARRSVPQRYSVVFQNGHTTMLTAHALLTVIPAAPRQAPPFHPSAEPIHRRCSIASSTSCNAARSNGRRRGGSSTLCESSMAVSWR